jgi:AcrR family transcriptional regulator
MSPRPTTGSAPPVRSRREEILDEATRLFAERGYEGASMADLAERVGLRKASLFHHFASKDVLYAAVLARLVEDVGAAISQSTRLGGSFAEQLDVLSDGITVILGAQPFAARLLIREVMDWGPVVRDHLADKMMLVLAASEAFVRAGQEEGSFVQAEPRQLIISMCGLHFMPFAIGELVKLFVGAEPSALEFIEPRREAVKEQVRRLMLAGEAARSGPASAQR